MSKAASSIRFQIRETPTSELIRGTLSITINDDQCIDYDDDDFNDDDDVAWYVCADREVAAQYTYE